MSARQLRGPDDGGSAFAGAPLAEDRTELGEEGGDSLHELHLHPLH